MKLYQNSEGKRQRIVPMWCDAPWQRRLWCFFRGHKDAPKVSMTRYHGSVVVACGICGRDLEYVGQSPSATTPYLNEDEKHWLFNGEPVTWIEFCDRMKGKMNE